MLSDNDMKCDGSCADRSEFSIVMAFQPVVDIPSRRIYAYEALVRGAEGQSAAFVLLIRPLLSVNQAAYFTRGSWKYFLTRSGDFSSICMCSVAAAFSLALVRAGTLVEMACFKSAFNRSSGFSSGL